MKEKICQDKRLHDLSSPCYIIDEVHLKNNFEGFLSALRRAWGSNCNLAYSIKTNPHKSILQTALNSGCIAEAVSGEEYKHAASCGFATPNIVFNGPIKTREAFECALRSGSIVNIDSKSELRYLREIFVEDATALSNARIGIRVNFDLEAVCPGETLTGKAGGRFGFSYENGELEHVINTINSLNDLDPCDASDNHKKINISGLHMHVTTSSRSVHVYRELSRFAVKIAREFSLDLDFVDIGGGFFGGAIGDEAAYDNYAHEIASELARHFNPENVELIIEPGGAVVCTPGYYMGRVLDVKDTSHGRFVTCDLSRVNIDHEMKKTAYVYEVNTHPKSLDFAQREIMKNQTLCGFSCMESDRLCVLENEHELFEGDLMVFKNAGAYSMSFSPGFFIRQAPTVYFKNASGNYVNQGKSAYCED